MPRFALRALPFALALALLPARAEEVEVLHYWHPEDDGALVLKEMVGKQGRTWKDFVIVPGGTNGLLTSLVRLRVMSGNPPFAALIRAPVARQWAREGRLAPLDEAARAGQWDKVFPKAVREAMKENEHYIAVPVSLYRENGLWVNRALFKRVGATPPEDWNGFFDAADKLRRAGIVAVAHGGQPRGNLHLFSSVALGVGGADFYRRAFVQRDPAELTGRTMEEVLRTFRRIKPYTAARRTQRDWPEVSQDVLEGRAAMVFMGGWTGPAFAQAGRRPGKDFACLPAPGSAEAFAFMIDSFAVFRPPQGDRSAAQRDFAVGLASPEVQLRFNQGRGAIPIRAGLDLARFDPCARRDAAAFRKAEERNALVPSLGMAVPAPVEAALADVVSAFWIDDSMAPKAAMALLADALK